MHTVLAAASQTPLDTATNPAGPSYTWRDVFNLRVEGWGLDVHVGIIFAIVVAVLIAFGALAHRSAARWRLTQADFTFAGCATVTMCPTDDVVGLAHQAWVEITTRKAAIPFNEDYDVVTEIYDSWYELFQHFATWPSLSPPDVAFGTAATKHSSSRCSPDRSMRAFVPT